MSAVGPYRFYGEPVVRACAEAGVDYLDLCGEPGEPLHVHGRIRARRGLPTSCSALVCRAIHAALPGVVWRL